MSNCIKIGEKDAQQTRISKKVVVKKVFKLGYFVLFQLFLTNISYITQWLLCTLRIPSGLLQGKMGPPKGPPSPRPAKSFLRAASSHLWSNPAPTEIYTTNQKPT